MALPKSDPELASAIAFAPLACAGRPRSPRWIVVRRGASVVGAAQLLRLGPLAWVERGPVTAAGDLKEVLAAIERAATSASYSAASASSRWDRH